jgi:hypothetical protein
MEQEVFSEEFTSIEKSFYFAQEIKKGQVNKGYRFEASLEEVNDSGSFSMKWGNSEEFYALDLIPADNEVKFLKHFDGKDCLEVEEVNLISRSNSMILDVVEDTNGKVIISLGGNLMFENTREAFIPSLGKYTAKGDLKVARFKLH